MTPKQVLLEIDHLFGQACGHGHIGLLEKNLRDGHGNDIGPPRGTKAALAVIRRYGNARARLVRATEKEK